jgi:hypothetical protein
MDKTHVRLGLPLHDETLKICGVPPLTLTVIDCVPDDIVCGLATLSTTRLALDVVDDEPAAGIVSVNWTFPLPLAAPEGEPPFPELPPRNDRPPPPPQDVKEKIEASMKPATRRPRMKKGPPIRANRFSDATRITYCCRGTWARMRSKNPTDCSAGVSDVC